MNTYFLESADDVSLDVEPRWASDELGLSGDTLVSVIVDDPETNSRYLRFILEHYQVTNKEAMLLFWRFVDHVSHHTDPQFYRKNLLLMAGSTPISTFKFMVDAQSGILVFELKAPIQTNKFLIQMNTESIYAKDLAIGVMNSYKEDILSLSDLLTKAHTPPA